VELTTLVTRLEGRSEAARVPFLERRGGPGSFQPNGLRTEGEFCKWWTKQDDAVRAKIAERFVLNLHKLGDNGRGVMFG
jgi:hypothetical protein